MQEITDKNTLRIRALGARKSIGAEEAGAAAEAIATHLLKHIPPSVKIVAGYCAIHNEIDVSLTLNQLHARGVTLCLPVVLGNGQPLVFRRWQPGDAMEKGKYGIDEPLASQPEQVPDAVIIPLAAFDGTGHRLGYGAGYYDRTIPQLRARKPGVKLIGAAYAIQQVERIPADGNDQKLDMVITEKGVILSEP